MRYDRLIKFFSEKIKKTANIAKDNFMSFLETDKDYSKKLRGKISRKELEDKSIKQMETRINRDISKNIESEEDYYKPVIVGNFW